MDTQPSQPTTTLFLRPAFVAISAQPGVGLTVVIRAERPQPPPPQKLC